MRYIGIYGDSDVYGIPCAKVLFGVEVVEEVLDGATRYLDHEGKRIQRVSEKSHDEDEDCPACASPLYECNAYEVKA